MMTSIPLIMVLVAGPTDGGDAATFYRALGAIEHYDIRYSVTVAKLLDNVRDSKKRRRVVGNRVFEYPGRVIEFRPMPGGSRVVTERDYRMVYSKSRRRAEFVAASGKPSVRIFDGTLEKGREGKFGDIRAKSMGLVQRDHDYESFLRLALDGVSYRLLAKDRPEPRFQRVTEDGAVRVLLRFESDENTRGFRQMTFDVYLDPDRGMLPAKVEIKMGEKLFCRRVVDRFHQLPDGSWAPVEMTTWYFQTDSKMSHYREPMQKCVIKVDVENSTWNQPVKDEEFVLAFPEGTSVTDDVRKLKIIAGKGDTGKNIDDLVKNAKVAISTKDDEPETGPPAATSNRTFWIIALNVLIVILLAAGLIWYKRRARASAA